MDDRPVHHKNEVIFLVRLVVELFQQMICGSCDVGETSAAAETTPRADTAVVSGTSLERMTNGTGPTRALCYLLMDGLIKFASSTTTIPVDIARPIRMATRRY